MRIGRGKVKGLYRSVRKEFLRTRGSEHSAYLEARRFTREALRFNLPVGFDEPWFRLMLSLIRTGRMWSKLTVTERDLMVTAVRGWGPVAQDQPRDETTDGR